MKNCATLLGGFTSERLVIKNLKTFLKLCSMLHIFWNNAYATASYGLIVPQKINEVLDSGGQGNKCFVFADYF